MSQRVFMTGATGFVGSRLAARLASQHIETHICIRPASQLWRLKDFQHKLQLHEVDLLDEKKIKQLIKKINPDYVFHLACYGGFADQDDPAAILDTNIHATLYLLNACAQTSVKKFISIGSSSEYGFQSEAMAETHREAPYNIYGISKLAATHLVRLYAQKQMLPAAILRIFSPYGPYDDPKRLIPSVICACLAKKPLALGSGQQVRDFVYIEDLIDAFLLSLEKAPGNGEIINLGSGKQHTIAEAVNLILAICNHPVKPLWHTLPDRKNEPLRWEANIQKAVQLLNWQPQTDLITGLTATVDWHKQQIEREKT